MPEDNTNHRSALKWFLLLAVLVALLLLWLVGFSPKADISQSLDSPSEEEIKAKQKADLDELRAAVEADGTMPVVDIESQKQELDRQKSESETSPSSPEEQKAELDKLRQEMSN